MAKADTATTESLLPNGPEASGEEEIDLSELRVNFSKDEAASEGRSFEPIPSGIYHCAIVKVELRKSKSTKNPGKPFYNIQFKVQSHRNEDYVNRVVFGSVMLFDGALYSYAQLAKAIGREDVLDSGIILSPGDLQGEELLVIVQKKRDTYKENQEKEADPNFSEHLWKNDVSGYKSLGAGASSGDGANSLMP